MAKLAFNVRGSSISNIGASGSSLTMVGANALTLTTTAPTTATFPAGTVTVVTTAAAQTLTGKTISAPILNESRFATQAAVTASATNAQGQGALVATGEHHVITTAAGNPSAVTLPTPQVGRRIFIVNRGANPVNVYPNTNAQIDTLGTNNPFSLPVNGVVILLGISTTQWYSSENLKINAAGGVSITDDTTTNAERFVTFSDQTTGTETILNVSSTKFTFNPSSGQVTATDFNTTSDFNLKTNIVQAKGLDVVLNLTGVEFDYIDTNKHASGVIAQNVESIIPHAVSTNAEGYKTVAYQQIIAHLIESIKEQQTQINSLKEELDRIKNN